MGRNAGSKIHWSHEPSISAELIWYCQQHAKWDKSPATFLVHVQTEHGNVRQ